jgi:hypothetical protein
LKVRKEKKFVDSQMERALLSQKREYFEMRLGKKKKEIKRKFKACGV